MTDKKNNNPRSQSSMTSFLEPKQCREQAEQQAKDIPLPDLGTMTHEEIQQRFHELRVKQIEAELQNEHLRSQREERDYKADLFSIVTGNMLDMVALTDMEGNFTFAGKAHEILGYEVGFLIGKNVMDFVHPEDLPRILEEFDESVASGQPRRVEYRYRCEDGTYLWLETVGNFITDERGSPQKIVFSSRNITEKKQAEEALRASEEKFRSIFASMTEIVALHELVCDADGKPVNYRILECNPAFTRITGIRREDAAGRLATDVYGSDSAPYLDEYARVALTGEPCTFITAYAPMDKHFEIHVASPGKNMFVTVTTDITERKQAEQQLKESEERFSKAFRSSPAPQVISDIKTGEFIDVNDRWVDMLGYSREQSIGRTSKEVGIWADPGERDRIIQKLQENTFFNEEPVEFRTSNGSTVYALWSAERITLGGCHVMLSMLYDETERKQSEKEQERLQAQLAQAQKMESVGRLAGGVAHDFNNKLSIINGYSELTLEMLAPEEPVYENLREIHSAGKRSANIVRQLLAFARQQTISPVRMDLNDTISNMLKMLQRLIGENIDLAWHPGKNLWQIKIDPSQIDQIMANLAVNARDAIEDVGKLIIETKNVVIDEDHCRQYSYFVPGRYVMLAVSDNGCGMEKEVQGNLFEPFFTTKGVGKGTGLGMSTIYGIVKQNKGFINAYSEPGHGTTFKIYLPPDEEFESGSLPYPKESAKQIPTGSETVLLVEDEPAILKMGKEMLEKLGYTVLSAEKPDDALRLAKEYEGKIHLLVTDVVMPEMNGRDLAANLSDCSPGLKSIYMSGYTADVIAHHGVLDEGVHFIQKPFSIQDLAVKVREAIEQQ